MIEHSGTGLAWGAAAGLAVIAADRLVGLGGVVRLETAWWWLAAIPMVAGAGIGVGRAVLTRPSLLMAAGAVDDALALRDRLTTGLTLRAGQDAAFTELALREADVAAASARPKSAAEIRVTNAWYTWPSLAAVAACMGLFVPQFDLLGFEQTAKRVAIEQTRRDDVAAGVAEAIEAVAPRMAEQALPDARATQLAELEKLREELEAGTLSADEATAKAVSELQSIAQESERAADQAAARSRAVSKSLSGLGRSAGAGEAAPEGAGADGADSAAEAGAARGDAQGSEAAANAQSATAEAGAEESPLTRAVRDGDLAAAREAARELMRRDRLSAQERQELAEDLRKLAADIEQLEQQEEERAAEEAAERAAAAEEADDGQGAGSDSAKPETEARESGDSAKPREAPQGDQPPGAAADAQKNPGGESVPEQKPAANAGDAKAEPKPAKSTGDSPKQQAEAPKQAGDPPRENQKPESGNADTKPRPGAEEGAKRGEQLAERTGEPEREASGKPEQAPNSEQTGKPQGERTGSGTERSSQGKTSEKREGQPQTDGKPQEPRNDGTTQQRDEPNSSQERSSAGKTEGERSESGESGDSSGVDKRGERREVSERELREQFERSGMTPQDAQRAAEKVGERMREEDAGRQANEERRELAERLKDAAKSLSGERAEGSPPRQQDASKGVQPEQTGDATGQPRSAERPEGTPDAKQGEMPAENAKAEPAAKPEGTRPSAQERAGQPDRPEAGQPQGTNTEKSPGTEEIGEEPSPGEGGGDRQMPDEIPAPSKQMLEQLAKQLDRMTSDGAQQKSDRAAGERAREQAQKLAENLSPQQQERLRQWAEGLAKERPDLAERLANQRGEEQGPPQDLAQGPAGGPRGEEQPMGGGGDADGRRTQGGGPDGGLAPDDTAPPTGQVYGPARTEVVDARGTGAKRPGMSGQRDQVVGEWLAPPTPGSARATGPTAEDRMRQAAKSAQQAVDDRAIPSRYDRLVQRYFRRLPEKVAQRAAPTPPPVQAQDAP